VGVPNDTEFQKRVLLATLALLDQNSGPVLEDFPDDAPELSSSQDENAMNGMFCPIALPKPVDDSEQPGDAGSTVLREIESLAPWYDLAVRSRGRTTVGPSGMPIKDAARFVMAFLEDQTVPAPHSDQPYGRLLKLAYEDIKAYYGEAITAQPGLNTSLQIENWLFNETSFGKALWSLRDICQASDDEYFQYLGKNSIVPDRQINPA